ncbi:MAG TPA: hypothetical protein VGJ70_17320 [Solirubrobacteraceae bacterium]
MTKLTRVSVAVVLAACAVAGAAGAADRVANVLPNGGFESNGTRNWTGAGPAVVRRTGNDAESGRFSLVVTARRGGTVGASMFVPGDRLRESGFLSPVTRTLRGTYDGSVWIRGSGGAAGKQVTVQLNEAGGAVPQEVLGEAATAVPLTKRWKRVSVHGAVRRPDRTGVDLLVVLNEARRGERIYLDGARIGGDPLGKVVISKRGRWHWWEYALVWAVVLAGGAAWLVLPRRRRKTAGVGVP